MIVDFPLFLDVVLMDTDVNTSFDLRRAAKDSMSVALKSELLYQDLSLRSPVRLHTADAYDGELLRRIVDRLPLVNYLDSSYNAGNDTLDMAVEIIKTKEVVVLPLDLQ